MHCNCSDFRCEFVNSAKEILAEADRSLQWEMFRQFLSKNFMHEDMSNNLREIICSRTICRHLTDKLDEYKSCYSAIPTLLLDLITILYECPCAQSNVHLILNFEKMTSFSITREFRRIEEAFCRQSGIMELLLQFGFLTRFPDDESPRFMDILEIMLGFFIARITDGIFYPIAEEAMELLDGTFFRYGKKENRKRIFLAALALLGIRLNIMDDDYIVSDYFWPEHTMSCLKMYFTATRDVFLSAFEVRSVLYVCLKLNQKLHLFDMFCEDFDKIMPEYSAKTKPRTLAHLARCQIRENLKVSQLPLPSAIDRLFSPELLLPMSFKSYLLGEVLDIDISSRETRHVSSQKFVTQSELALLLSK